MEVSVAEDTQTPRVVWAVLSSKRHTKFRSCEPSSLRKKKKASFAGLWDKSAYPSRSLTLLWPLAASNQPGKDHLPIESVLVASPHCLGRWQVHHLTIQLTYSPPCHHTGGCGRSQDR